MTKEKLLILDDETRILSSLEDLFEDDYEVLTASDAETAMRLVQEYDVAVILTDERMPGLSGHEFLQKVKDISKATRVMISGYADMHALTEAVNRGQIFAYVGKPWEPIGLKATIGAAMGQFRLIQTIDRERALLQVLMESIPDLIYFKNSDSRFTCVNRGQARALGAQDPEDCVGKKDSDYFEAEYAHKSYEDEQEIVRTGRPLLDRVEELKKAGGQVCWMSTSRVPIFDKSGVVTGIAGVSRDISGLKKVEGALRESSEHNRLIIETANDAFIGTDADGTITAWNRQAELTFGWSAAEVAGRGMSDTIIPLEHRQGLAGGVERFWTHGAGVASNRRIDLEALHKNGLRFPVELTIWPVQSGETYSFNAFVRDLTERRQAEEALMEEKTLVQLLQTVTVAANESSTLERAAQICLERICSFTKWPVGHVLSLADESPNELISAGLWHVEGKEQYTDFQKATERSRFASGEGLPGRVLESGAPEWIADLAQVAGCWRASETGPGGLRSAFGFPILAENKVIGILEFFALEATEPTQEFLKLMAHVGSQLGQVILRQRAKEDLEHARYAAESASRAKSEFLATMSHEIRTPMNAILGMADLLSETPLDPIQRDYVAIFQRSGTKLLGVINDILDLSKVESGRFELESIDFDLGAVLEKTIEIVLPRAQAKGLALTFKTSPAVPLRLNGDPDRLGRVLINLIANAIKFTDKGSVSVTVERDAAGSSEGSLRFNITDTGIGIPPEKQDMIFGSFSQADSSTTRKYGGTGLGLAICKGLAELMGGSIDVTSEVGKGSTFSFTVRFSLAKAPIGEKTRLLPESVQPPAAADASRPATRILIAEDSEDNLFLVKAYLKGPRFECEVARNGQQAVEKVLSGDFDLVLMDLQMPVMDGYEATGWIREWEKQNNRPPIPILALTAHALAEYGPRTLAAGCTAHLTKPISKATLLNAIAKYSASIPAASILVRGNPDLRDLMPRFFDNRRSDLEAMREALKHSNLDAIRILGHNMKGFGGGYGLPEITAIGLSLEAAAKREDGADIRKQLAVLSEFLANVQVVYDEKPAPSPTN
ncbi:MAG: response regulator [Acidobacteriota bacterium]|nr:response regulator [Acidobacteriota bacterium]